MKTLQKEIGWSYPTSPNTVRFGFARTGCWVVSVVDGQTPPRAVSGHDTFIAAQNAADAMPIGYSRYSVSYARD